MLIAGLALIIKGGDMFVDGAVRISRLAKIPEAVIGATVVSVGTTLPELLTSLTSLVRGMRSDDPAALTQFTDIAVGNSIGSMLCNAGLILALTIIVRPRPVPRKTFAPKGIFLLLTTALVCVFSYTSGVIDVAEGVVLLIVFTAFVTLNTAEGLKNKKIPSPVPFSEKPLPVTEQGIRAMRESEGGRFMDETEKRLLISHSGQETAAETAAPAYKSKKPREALISTALFAIGAAGIAVGAMLLVDNVQFLCVTLGIPQQIVSVTVVAVGTSLPELVTAITSLRKGSQDLSLGNIIGANVINATLLLGMISCVAGGTLAIDWFTRNYAVWFTLAITALLVIPTLVYKKTFRLQGGLMVAAYAAFLTLNVLYAIKTDA